MIEREFSTAQGVLTYWDIPVWSRQAELSSGLEAAGFGKFAPSKRPATASLNDALADTHRGRKFRIVPLQKRDGFEVRLIEPISDTENQMTRLFGVTIDDAHSLTFHPTVPGNCGAICRSLDTHKDLVRTAEVSAGLVGIIKALNGTSFPGGHGLYFIPPDKLPEWRKVAAAVEGAKYIKDNAVYLVKHNLDPDSIRAIMAGLKHEVITRLEEINSEINSGTLRRRAIEARQREALMLEAKIKEYEALLGVGLESLHEAVQRTEDAILQASILASAAMEHAA